MEQVTSEERERRRALYAEAISGDEGADEYRKFKGGTISEERAMQVYDACVEVVDSGQTFNRRLAFRLAVRDRLEQDPYKFGPITILFIVKLVALFIQLWFLFQDEPPREGK